MIITKQITKELFDDKRNADCVVLASITGREMETGFASVDWSMFTERGAQFIIYYMQDGNYYKSRAYLHTGDEQYVMSQREIDSQTAYNATIVGRYEETEENFQRFRAGMRRISRKTAKRTLDPCIIDEMQQYEDVHRILVYPREICIFERSNGSKSLKYIQHDCGEESNVLEQMERRAFFYFLIHHCEFE